MNTLCCFLQFLRFGTSWIPGYNRRLSIIPWYYMQMKMKYGLASRSAIILNQVKAGTTKTFFMAAPILPPNVRTLEAYSPSNSQTSLKCSFGRISVCPFEAGPISKIARNLASSYTVADGISPFAILQNIQLSSFMLHSSFFISAIYNCPITYPDHFFSNPAFRTA